MENIGNESTSKVFGRVLGGVGALAGAHLQLAKAELAEQGRTIGLIGIIFAVALWSALAASLLLSVAAAIALVEFAGAAVAFLTVGLLWAVLAVALVLAATMVQKRVNPLEKTLQELEKDREWANQQTS